jgi:tetratricopeptide (TPR) repeat protein
VKTGAVVVTATLLLAAGVGAAQADGPSAHAIAEGRYHLRRANGLAGDDRCQAAIHEYTLAYKKLGDPVVLFNRAECYRRIGEDEKAVADYRAFLQAVPAAPNRAEIEAKVSALDAKPSPVAGPAPARPNGQGPERATAPPPVRPNATASPYLSPERPPLIDDTPLPTSSAPPPALALVQTAPAASAPADGEGHHGKTWIWLAVGAAVAGGAVGAYFAFRSPATVPPTTDLGNYKF